jgi:hypothetical protein
MTCFIGWSLSLAIAQGYGRFTNLLSKLVKTDLLILDNRRQEIISLSQLNDFLKIMEDLHGVKSSLNTNQLPITHWHNAIGDSTLA